MRRIISVWFPEFPVQRFLRERHKLRAPSPAAGLPFALVEKGQKGLRLYAVNITARSFGIAAGQRLADARAAVPELLTEPHAPEKDMGSLLGLARWMERYSPWVAPDGTDGLLLDATGVAHLFGGEAKMQNDMQARLHAYGFTTRTAIASTIGAAWALARFGKVTSPALRAPSPGGRDLGRRPPFMIVERGGCNQSLPSGEGARRAGEVTLGSHAIVLPESGRAVERKRDEEGPLLHPLPIEALRIDAQATRTLRRLGLKTIGSLLTLPRASLARRFRGETIHENVLLRLDELTGVRHEALNAINPPSSFIAHRAMMEPVISHEGLDAVLTGLCNTLTRDLEAKGQGATRLILKLFKTDGGRAQVPAGLSAPSHDARHILRLLRPKLETLDAGFGIDAMTLEARETAGVAAHQHGFMEDENETSLAELNDRVMNRQERPLTRLEAVASHVPERAERAALIRPSGTFSREKAREKARDLLPSLALLAGEGGQRPDEGGVFRPLLIFETPEPARVIAAVPDGPPMRLTWRRVTRKITRSQGPERIAPEWWRLEAGERARDYYHVEDEQGRRYWLYRDGLYGEDDGPPPKWFVHGLSA
jgi:protein ImuB